MPPSRASFSPRISSEEVSLSNSVSDTIHVVLLETITAQTSISTQRIRFTAGTVRLLSHFQFFAAARGVRFFAMGNTLLSVLRFRFQLRDSGQGCAPSTGRASTARS